ncbi:hypothetical protein MPSEU_000225100 [Mayamaea pseudoterrestris]|nr:hypothetical protein MPSEU_000225100 [Mayamaea pseudoterrestris]
MSTAYLDLANAVPQASSADASGMIPDDSTADRLADELRPFVPQNALPAGRAEDLQLAICRKLRELLPSNRELLRTAQENQWIPILLSWLSLHDRPAVQVEALLALTSVAELCAQQAYQDSAALAMKSGRPLDATSVVDKYRQSLAPGSVPFPPLSFRQAFGPDAVAAVDQSMTSILASYAAGTPIISSNAANTAVNTISGGGVDAANSFSKFGRQAAAKRSAGTPLSSATPPAVYSGSVTTTNASGLLPVTGGINFSSLAPPPGGAHSTVPTNAFLPPPTPVTAPHFPQQLSSSSQHLLLRHADAIPTLISLLTSYQDKQVYEQAMWILGSIAAGDAPSSTGGSSGSNSNSNSNSSSSLGGAGTNAADGTTNGTNNASSAAIAKTVSARDVILAAGVMSQLLRCLEAQTNNISLQRIGSWTLSNLVDGIFQQHGGSGSTGGGSNGGHKSNAANNSNAISANTASNSSNANTANSSTSPSKDYSSVDEIDMPTLLPVLKRLLHMSDSEVLGYTCWTLSHLCDGPSSHIAAVVSNADGTYGGLVPRLVELLVHPSWRVTKPALRTIGNIVCAECSDEGGSSTDYTEVILDCQAVPRLKELVTHTNREIQKEACWTLSNIAAGTVDQIQAVIDSGAIRPLVKLVKDKRTDQEVRTEACWVVLNATSCGSDAQIEILVDEGCVSVLGVLLSEASMVMMALEGLERVLQVEQMREIIRREQIENGEIEDTEATRTPILVSASLIEKARESHTSTGVTKRADRIWKQHFVSCALCKMSFSKHRTSDASFCEECKCHVCSHCNCNIYHLDYQEELWAATEEENQAKQNAKKSKNKKKKAKLKEKKAKQQEEEEPTVQFDKNVKQSNCDAGEDSKDEKGSRSRTSIVSEASENDKKDELESSKANNVAMNDENSENHEDVQNQIDFVLYLEQTGSIIALAKLMDALEYGGDDFDEELSDYERRMIREQQLLRAEQANSAH